MIDEKKLRTAAKELNEALGLDPKINLKAKAKELQSKIIEAAELIDEEDEFSEVTTEVLALLVPKEDDEEDEAPKTKGKKGKKPAPVEEDDDEEDEDEDEVAEKIHQKNIGKKGVNAGKKKVVEDEDDDDDEEEDEAPKKKKAKTKKVGGFVKTGESMQEIADRLLKAKADKKVVKAEFVKAYKERKDITDPEFIAKRIKIYMKIAEDKIKK